MALPTLTVLLDDGTATFPLNVSSKVMAVDGYSVSRGRSDWQGAVTAGELTITFNNSDGYFTVGAGAVFVDQQIQLKETVNGVTYTRFTGYVKSWPTSWPAVVVTFSTVSPAATDAQARAERTTLRSMLEEEILLDSPSAYYTLGEAAGSTTAGDSSGNQATPLVSVANTTNADTGIALTMGTGTGPVDGLSATQFFGGTLFLGLNGVYASAAASFTLEAFVNSTFTTIKQTVIQLTDGSVFGGGNDRVTIEIDAGTGVPTVRIAHAGTAGTPISGGASIANGLTHHVAATYNGAGTIELFVDGVSVASVASGVTLTDRLSTLFVGHDVVGTLSHVAVYGGVVLTPTQIATHAAIGSSTFTESGTARITRLAGYADIPVGTLDTSMTTVPVQATTDVSAFAAIQDVADAEGGLVFINGSGNLTFHNRARPSTKTAPDLTLDKQWVTPDVQPVLDDQQLVNHFEATASATGSAQLAHDLTSEAAHGRYPDSKTYLVLTDQEALDRANWAVGKLAEPVPRYGTLTINLYGMTASQASTVLAALDLNCWLRVTSMASQTPGGTTADVVVEGWQEQTTAESWTITCNVVDRSLFEALILDDATFGLLDSYALGL